MKKIINILVIVAICQLALALFLGLRPDRLASFRSDQSLVEFQVEDLKQIKIGQRVDQKEEYLLLTKKDGQWVMAERDNLPVATAKIETLFSNLSALKVEWPVATTLITAKQFDLGSDNWQKKIELTGKADQKTTLLLGSAPSFKKVYARVDGDHTSYSLDFPAHELSTKVDDWFDRSVAKVERSTISRLTLADIDIIRQDGELTLADIPANQEVKKVELGELLTRLTELTVQDYLGTEAKPEYGQEKPLLQYKITLQSGEELTYIISHWQDGDLYVLKTSHSPFFLVVPKNPVDQSKELKRADLLAARQSDQEANSVKKDQETDASPEESQATE